MAITVHVRNHRDVRSDHSKIVVLDGWDDVKAEGHGALKVDLPPGLYSVQVLRAGESFQKVIRHTGPTEEVWEEPLRSSAMPTFDTSTAREYYSYPAMRWSREDTGQAAELFSAGAGASRLFIFVRAQSRQDSKSEDPAKDMSLLRRMVLWSLASIWV